MKKIISSIVGILLCFSGFGQHSTKILSDTTFDHGSNIVFPTLTSQLIDNLDLLGHVWGFLKYHHPNISQGHYNWDYELFRMLPEYLQITDNQKRDTYLVKWIQQYGKIRTNNVIIPVDSDAFLKPDLTWINQERLSPKLYKSLMNVYQHRNQSIQFYVAYNFYGAKNAKFLHENAYSNMSYPDAGFRLLAVYRYWNMVQYYFPYKYLMEMDWNDVLKEVIPIMLNASDAKEYFFAIKRMVAKCNDSHGFVFQNKNVNVSNHIKDVPFRVRFLNKDTLVVLRYFNPEKFVDSYPQIGDIITQIDGRPVSEIVDSLVPYYAASNYNTLLRDIAYNIMRGDKDNVTITFITSKKSSTSTIQRYPTTDLNYDNYFDDKGTNYQVLTDSVGYVYMRNLTKEYLTVLFDTLRHTKAAIFDARDGNSLGAFELSQYLADDVNPIFKVTEPSFKNPGEFIYSAPIYLKAGKEIYNKKIVVLINEYVQSEGETAVMELLACTNCCVMGSCSAGANGNISKLELPGGIQTMFSGIGIYFPDGRNTQRIGIIPDIYVCPTVNGLREGRDEVLEKALELLNNE